MRITNFTRDSISPLRQEVEKALEEVGKKHGVYFSFGSISFSSATASTRLAIYLRTEDTSSTKEFEQQLRTKKMSDDFLLNCKSFGMDPSLIGQPFSVGRKSYTLLGSNARSQYPIIGLSKSGAMYKFSLEQVLSKSVATSQRRGEEAIMKDIYSVYVHMSSENITGDGERSRSEVTRLEARYRAELKKLIEEIRRPVSEDQAYDWASSRREHAL